MGHQIHYQERNVADNVYVPELGAELHAVERCDSGFEAHKIGQMQVAMTFTNEAVIASVIQI